MEHLFKNMALLGAIKGQAHTDMTRNKKGHDMARRPCRVHDALLLPVLRDEVRRGGRLRRRLPVVEAFRVRLPEVDRVKRDALLRRFRPRRRLPDLCGDFPIRHRRGQQQLHRFFLYVHHIPLFATSTYSMPDPDYEPLFIWASPKPVFHI